jgi:hypothetical protein
MHKINNKIIFAFLVSIILLYKTVFFNYEERFVLFWVLIQVSKIFLVNINSNKKISTYHL